MGDFFTSTQIFNSEKQDREKFIENFCNKMTGEGYVTCDSDESELSYILKFADNCKWVTITSEAYEQGNKMSKEDTGRIAKMLGTTCVNTVGIDSDCAILELYDESGKKADTLIMGRADDYFGDDIPRPSEKIWKPFLYKDNTWEQFCNIVEDSDSYTFVEDGLSELASLIGMDDRNISFSADEAIDDEQTLFLYFRKAEAKKAKKLTLNAAFKQVFGEALEPLGFKLVKSRQPYFVRVINNEILHVITVVKKIDNRFDIFGGIATVYRQEISFERPFQENEWWLYNNIYCRNILNTIDDNFSCPVDDRLEFCTCFDIKEEMQRALSATQKILIYLFNKTDTLEKCVETFADLGHNILIYYKDDLGNSYPANFCNEGLLIIKTMNLEQYCSFLDDYNAKIIKENKKRPKNTQVSEERLLKRRQMYKDQMLDSYKKILADKSWLEKVNIELEKRKNHNIKFLEEYGLIKKEENNGEKNDCTTNLSNSCSINGLILWKSSQ